MPLARPLGLVDDATWAALQAREKAIAETLEQLGSRHHEGTSLLRLLRRPENTFADIEALAPALSVLSEAVKEQVEIEAKYAGYIERQKADIERFGRMEARRIPDDLNYGAMRAGPGGQDRRRLPGRHRRAHGPPRTSRAFPLKPHERGWKL
jgi:tRNA U34 5-carboxymethylaminomethyl modifying enzyme MnmG/GidA